jgi:2-oxoisovalerate dehydrogenase E1 component
VKYSEKRFTRCKKENTMPKSLFISPSEARAKSTIKFQSIPINAYNKTIAQEKGNYSAHDLMQIYRDITILREFETMLNLVKTQSAYNGVETTYPGPAHLSLGQEAAVPQGCRETSVPRTLLLIGRR